MRESRPCQSKQDCEIRLPNGAILVQHGEIIPLPHGPALKNRQRRLGNTVASATCTTSAISATSCTRTICAPPNTDAAPWLSCPTAASAAGHGSPLPASAHPTNTFRDVPTTSGKLQRAPVPEGAASTSKFCAYSLPKPIPSGSMIAPGFLRCRHTLRGESRRASPATTSRMTSAANGPAKGYDRGSPSCASAPAPAAPPALNFAQCRVAAQSAHVVDHFGARRVMAASATAAFCVSTGRLESSACPSDLRGRAAPAPFPHPRQSGSAPGRVDSLRMSSDIGPGALHFQRAGDTPPVRSKKARHRKSCPA